MLRPSSLRPLLSRSTASTARLNVPRGITPLPLSSRTSIFRSSTPTISRPRNAIVGFSTSAFRGIDPKKIQPDLTKEREELRNAKIQPNPEEVTTTSTMRPLMDMGAGEGSGGDDVDMMKGIRTDMKTVRETFALREVPKEVYYFGAAGLLPYVLTSASTMYMAWDIQHAKDTGLAVLISKDTAEALMSFGEPLQIGLGAVILSFLGAIHWGLEFANYGGSHPYRRYTIGILAPVLAWPTIMLPFDYALLVQFAGFTGMYFADVQATTWGWAPRWYHTYRFVLTFVVGACIITTLVGRGKISDALSPAQRAQQQLAALKYDSQYSSDQKQQAKAEEKEIARRKAEKAQKEEEGSGEKRDPGKKAAEGKPGQQGIHADENQNKEGGQDVGSGPEPGPEKKGMQKGMEEGGPGGRKNAAMKG